MKAKTVNAAMANWRVSLRIVELVSQKLTALTKRDIMPLGKIGGASFNHRLEDGAVFSCVF